MPALRVALAPVYDQDSAYMEGRNAFLQGRYREDNPYFTPEWAREWDRGWAEVSSTPVDDGKASMNEVINEHYPEDWE